jgi:hypothetical protein
MQSSKPRFNSNKIVVIYYIYENYEFNIEILFEEN